jgi:undecaprenyl-diphosphatase
MEQWGPGLAVILGIVEGLTEYLPVSSTGHLILVSRWLGFSGEVADTVDIAIQLGAILAVVVYERTKLKTFLGQAWREQVEFRRQVSAGGERSFSEKLHASMQAHRSLWFLIGLGVAFLPAGAIGFLTHKWIEKNLFNPITVAAALIVGGFIIMWIEAWKHEATITELDRVPLFSAFMVGVAQCASLIPGTSRSGATIIGGLLVGMDRKVATEYSFFLALPTLIIATGYKLIKAGSLLNGADLMALFLGMVVSFLVAWAVIAGFLAFVQRHTLNLFAYYRIVLGIDVLAVFH